MVQKPLEVLLVSPVSNSERGWSQYSFPLFFKYHGCVRACVFMPCIDMLLNVFFVALLFALIMSKIFGSHLIFFSSCLFTLCEPDLM
jgi:hypothetical protein